MSEKPVNKVLDALGKAVGQTFQLDRLDELCSGSVLLRAAWAECIANINACMLIERLAEGGDTATPEITSIKIGNNQFPITPKGRKGAIAWSFWHMANKLDDYLSTANLRTLLVGMDFVKDIATATLTGTRVSQSTTSRPYIHPGDLELLKK